MRLLSYSWGETEDSYMGNRGAPFFSFPFPGELQRSEQVSDGEFLVFLICPFSSKSEHKIEHWVKNGISYVLPIH